MSKHRFGIVGGGVGGLTAALALQRLGQTAVVFEQAAKFQRVGADINLTPNAVRALDGLGLGPALRVHAARPTFRISRMWDSGEETSRLPMSDAAEAKYGSPQLTTHRGDLMASLEAALPGETIFFGRRIARIDVRDGGVAIDFADGSSDVVDYLVGADGIHSVVRRALFGEEAPKFTGIVSFRAVVPSERLADLPDVGAFVKWWGPDPFSQIITFPLAQGRETFVFATIPQDSWKEESWTTMGDVRELSTLYANFHPEARRLLEACDTVMKSALYERDPMPRWSQGRATLLGDACHPMLPFMAQGAGMAIEDAVMLARCVEACPEDIERSFLRYEEMRRSRTSRIQQGSRGNAWLKTHDNPDWVYGYDVWTIPLDGSPQSIGS